jgi:hypothetical protein
MARPANPLTAALKAKEKRAAGVFMTVTQHAALEALPDSEEGAVPLTALESVFPNAPRPTIHGYLERLFKWGYIDRVQRQVEDPEYRRAAHVHRFTRPIFHYWRTPAGDHALAHCVIVDKLASERAFHRRVTEPDPYFKLYNVTRGAVTFRATCAAFGITNDQEWRALRDAPRPKRDAFHAAWTQAMYDACAADGTPIADQLAPPNPKAKHGMRPKHWQTPWTEADAIDSEEED